VSAKAPDRAEAVGGSHAGGVGGRARSTPSTHALSAGESTWIVALPCALLLLAIVVLVGRPLGRALFEPTGAEHIWPRFFDLRGVRPEPTEHARYVLSLLGPVLVVGAALLLRGRRLPGVVATVASVVTQVALLAFVVVCIVVQRDHLYEVGFTGGRGGPHTIYFTNATLVVAAALALLIAFALSRPAVGERVVRFTRETPLRRWIAIGVAAVVTVAYLLSAYNTDGTINIAHAALWDHTAFYLDEAFSILNGQAPLVDFHAQYGHLWAYFAAGCLTLFGASLGVYAAVMLAGTAGTMAVVFATMRRLVGGSSLQTLLLFLPFVATSFFMKLGPPDNRYSPVSLFSLFPIRYAGPYVLLWLLVRRLDRGSARRPLALLALAGLIVINNPEFGIPGVGATLVGLVWTLPDRSPRGLARLALEGLAGLAIAVALVSTLTLAVGGGLPHFEMLTEYPRIFGTEGFGLLPMPSVGFHLVVYATFVAAIAVAAVRGIRGEDRALSIALAWVGIFGLGVGAYFTGRSHPHVLIDLFSVWSYALVLLAIVAIRAILRRPGRRPQLAELLVFAGIGAMACSLAQIPTPWSQIDRIRHTQPHAVRVVTALENAIREKTRPGEPVAVLVRPGHEISEQIGIRDITPYANIDSMMTEQMWEKMIVALQRAHGRQLFVQAETLFQEHIDWLAARGYRPYVEWRQLALIGFIRGKPPGRRAAAAPSRRSARP
jgi:hypothetical protein